jgi:hypothetical protein
VAAGACVTGAGAWGAQAGSNNRLARIINMRGLCTLVIMIFSPLITKVRSRIGSL